jgi:FlaA1/EpsC-like NDP-sugar epimerase
MCLSFLLRFDFAIPQTEMRHLTVGLLLAVPVKLAIFYLTRAQRGWWTSFSLIDLSQMVYTNFLASAIAGCGIFAIFQGSFPRSIYILDFVLTAGAISLCRVFLRLEREHPGRRGKHDAKKLKPVLIYGTGRAGVALMRELWANPGLGYRVIGFIDDHPSKHGEAVSGIPVRGNGESLREIVSQLKKRKVDVQLVLIAMPSATGREMRDAVAHCAAAGVPCKTLPGIGELLSNRGLSKQIRDISVEDLLGRDQVDLDEAAIRQNLAGRAVMVTGAAGSIGSELCRQIAAFQPKVLVLLDRAESDLFRIDMELRSKFPGLPVEAEIADICDFEHVDELIRQHRVECIYHAAAYKHVPLMEMQPVQAAENNIIGTWNLATSAYANHVKTFVMISSDKAVNPVNVMGATKRITELLVSSFPEPARGGATRFVSVRFGNVLASNGSVVPIFKAQIAAGGPVTVTHPEVRRYFMTVREAVQLVLQASTMGRGSEVFVLDMGEPVRISDLARNMIRLAGLVPDEHVEIKYTGLRPGEKLFEELITEGEHILPTYHEKIKIFQGSPMSAEVLENWIDRLHTLLDERDEAAVVAHMADLVPEYQISEHWKSRVGRECFGLARTAGSTGPPIPYPA